MKAFVTTYLLFVSIHFAFAQDRECEIRANNGAFGIFIAGQLDTSFDNIKSAVDRREKLMIQGRCVTPDVVPDCTVAAHSQMYTVQQGNTSVGTYDKLDQAVAIRDAMVTAGVCNSNQRPTPCYIKATGGNFEVLHGRTSAMISDSVQSAAQLRNKMIGAGICVGLRAHQIPVCSVLRDRDGSFLAYQGGHAIIRTGRYSDARGKIQSLLEISACKRTQQVAARPSLISAKNH